MIALLTLIGAMVGSFLNVCIYRIPEKISIVRPRSFCVFCRSTIRFYDNLPIISFLILLGRCRRCGRRISWQYPLVEILMACLSYLLFAKYGLSIVFFQLFVFSAALIVVSFIDIKFFIIPDSISLPGIVLGLVFAFLPGSIISSLDSFFGIILGGGVLLIIGLVYEKMTGKEGIGGGDIKLLAMIGAFLGFKAVLVTVFFSSVIGSIFGLLLVAIGRGQGRNSVIPFGPFLALGAFIALLWGDVLIVFYLGLNNA